MLRETSQFSTFHLFTTSDATQGMPRLSACLYFFLFLRSFLHTENVGHGRLLIFYQQFLGKTAL